MLTVFRASKKEYQMPTPVMIPMRDPIAAQNYKTQRGDSPEDLWQPLYDRVNIATTVPSSLGFFSNAQGQTATLILATGAGSVVKGYRDTNIQNSNVVPTKLFKFVGISIGFVQVPTSAANATNILDRDLILQGGYLQFKIVDKDILYTPLINLPTINPYAAVSTTANNTNFVASNPGGGQGNLMYRLPIPITLNPYENFQVLVSWPQTTTLTTTMDMYVFLQGFMRRPT